MFCQLWPQPSSCYRHQLLSRYQDRPATQWGISKTLSPPSFCIADHHLWNDTQILLSDTAINHLIQLPHLHTLCMYGPPPNYSTTSLPLVFPPLKKLTLGDSAVRGWLSFLGRLEDGASTTPGRKRLFKAKDLLKVPIIRDIPEATTINPSLVFPIQSFQNLAELDMNAYCRDGG